jgi:hypothetical protein
MTIGESLVPDASGIVARTASAGIIHENIVALAM